jgi:predicted alpha-1,6-mannanase (GH76 family)
MKLDRMLLLAACFSALGCSGDAMGASDDALSSSTRADNATSALVAHFYDSNLHYFRGAWPNNNAPAGYWIFAQAYDAVLDSVQRSGNAGALEKYVDVLYNDQAARGWQSDYFDDESWMSLALIRAYDVTHDAKYLSRAESLFSDIDQNGRTNAGVWWNRQHVEMATASNFGPALVAARLSERTGNATYKQAAQEIYDYWYSVMVDHTTSQVADHRDPNGTVDWSKYTYNTGLAIGASIELSNITGNAGYLSHAYAFGSYLIHAQVTSSSFGDVLYDHPCTGDCDAFKGIAFRNLMKLYEMDKTQTQYGDVLAASAKAIWSSARDTSANVFGTQWAGGAPTATSLAADASAVMSLNVAAEFGF